MFLFVFYWSLLKVIRFWAHEIPTKHSRENISDPQNTDEKAFWTHEIPTRKYFEPTKARWHETHEN